VSEKKLFLEIITPEGIVYSDKVEMVIAPAIQGTVGILPQHTPFFTKLNEGEIKIKKDGKEEFFTVYGGFMDVSQGGKVSIMTDGAKRVEEINMETARAAREKAEIMLKEKEKLTEVEYLKAEASLRKAILDLKAAQRRKRS